MDLYKIGMSIILPSLVSSDPCINSASPHGASAAAKDAMSLPLDISARPLSPNPKVLVDSVIKLQMSGNVMEAAALTNPLDLTPTLTPEASVPVKVQLQQHKKYYYWKKLRLAKRGNLLTTHHNSI